MLVNSRAAKEEIFNSETGLIYVGKYSASSRAAMDEANLNYVGEQQSSYGGN